MLHGIRIIQKKFIERYRLAEKLCISLYQNTESSGTTRPAREGEIDGEHYKFVTEEEFTKLKEKGCLLEHGSYQGKFLFQHFYVGKRLWKHGNSMVTSALKYVLFEYSQRARSKNRCISSLLL